MRPAGEQEGYVCLLVRHVRSSSFYGPALTIVSCLLESTLSASRLN